VGGGLFSLFRVELVAWLLKVCRYKGKPIGVAYRTMTLIGRRKMLWDGKKPCDALKTPQF
jgi:hypothetical protein